MKKIIIIITIVLLLTISIISLNKNKIKEEIKIIDETIIIKENIELNVYEKYYYSDLVTIKSGKLEHNNLIDTSSLGTKEIEINYVNNEKKITKIPVKYTVVDKIKPVILGSNIYDIKLGDDKDLRYLLFSGDNYDRNPQREVIGEYNYNEVGTYNLIFRVTDSSGNVNQEDLIINVYEKKKTKDNYPKENKFYEEIYKQYKTNKTKIGLDISRYQGDVDYNKLKSSKVEFVFLRIGFQKGFKNELGMDTYFLDNVKKANEVGIPVGVYFYSYATSLEEAEEQANWIINNIKDYKIDLPIVFDWESFSLFSKQNISIYDLNQIAYKFIEVVEKNGYQGMNYSSKKYLENVWNIPEHLVWLAHYTDKTNYEGSYYVWQLTDKGRVNGINGDVDINVMYE